MTANYSDLGTSVKMRIYSLPKRHILIVFIAFFLALFVSINIGLFGPPILKTISTSASNQSNVLNLKSGPFLLITPYLGKFHQQLWVTAQPIITGRKEEFIKPFTLNVHIHDQSEQLSSQTSMSSIGKKMHAEYFNKTRYFHCVNEICDTISLIHLDFLHLNQYLIEVKFFNLEDLLGLEIKDYIFTFNSYNPSFTKLELWFRFVFLAITFVILILYTRSLKKFSLRDWSIEQKWTFILLRSLLFFNNPLFPLNVLFDSWIPHVLDAVFQSTFLALVMVFWISLYHAVRKSDRNFLTFYVPKFIIVFLIWLMSILMLLWQQYQSLDDPTYNLTMDEKSYIIFRILFSTTCIVYLLFLVYLIVRAFAELRSMPYFGSRIKFSVALMLIVITTCCIIAILRLKSEAFRQSLFENFTKNYRSTVEFCTIFSIFNIYIYTLAFVYSPGKNASLDTDYRDNPTFSMLNDTDEEEDVVYGMTTLKN